MHVPIQGIASEALWSPCRLRTSPSAVLPCGERWPAAVVHLLSPKLANFRLCCAKLVKHLLEKQHVERWEMLPETWQLETESTCCHAKRPKRSLVTDISVWTECFATMAAVLL